MTNIAPVDNSTVDNDAGSIEEKLTEFVEATTSALEDTAAPEETVEAVEATGEELVEAVEEATVVDEQEQSAPEEDLPERVADLEDRSDFYLEDICDLETAVDDLEDRVDGLESSTDDAHTSNEDSATDCVEPQTHLEDVARLPSRVTEDESPNVRRALFVARDVEEYTEAIPAGRRITWSDLRRVLKAGTDASGHPETIRRVMEVLDDFGEDTTEIRDDDRHEKMVVFDDDAVARLEHLCSDEAGTAHAAVSPARG